MGGNITLSLKRSDVGQMLDGLEVRQTQWRDTALYLRDGIFPTPDFVPEEARDEEEAQNLADWYGRILSAIRKQRDAQKPKLEDSLTKRSRRERS